MDPSFRPSHIDSGAIYLHSRFKNPELKINFLYFHFSILQIVAISPYTIPLQMNGYSRLITTPEQHDKVINADSAFIILIILLVSQNGRVGQGSQGDQDGHSGQGNLGGLLVQMKPEANFSKTKISKDSVLAKLSDLMRGF